MIFVSRCWPRYQIRKMTTDYKEFPYQNIYLPCHSNEFECKITRKCIPRYFVQDGDDDCSLDYLVSKLKVKQ